MRETKQNVKKRQKGFTLLELLIVITIIAIMSVALVFVLNPIEILKKSRDTQRMADLSTLKTAIGVYMTASTTPQLDNTSGNTLCIGGSAADTIWGSYIGTLSGTPMAGTVWVSKTTSAAASAIDGTGWIPVNLGSLVGGSPISSMPLDPVNTVTTPSSVTKSDLIYRYACKASPLSFEIDATLESLAYGPGGSDDRSAKDGGNHASLFEMGTDLTILTNVDTY